MALLHFSLEYIGSAPTLPSQIICTRHSNHAASYSEDLKPSQQVSFVMTVVADVSSLLLTAVWFCMQLSQAGAEAQGGQG